MSCEQNQWKTIAAHTNRTANAPDPPERKNWVIPPSKETHPAKGLADSNETMEWVVEEDR